jgi:hypothetical protein
LSLKKERRELSFSEKLSSIGYYYSIITQFESDVRLLHNRNVVDSHRHVTTGCGINSITLQERGAKRDEVPAAIIIAFINN